MIDVNSSIFDRLVNLHIKFYEEKIQSVLILSKIEDPDYYRDFNKKMKKYPYITLTNYKNYILDSLELIYSYNSKNAVLGFFDCELEISKKVESMPVLFTIYNRNLTDVIMLEEKSYIYNKTIQVFKFDEFKETIEKFNFKHIKELV